MKIALTETDPDEAAFFEEKLGRHDLQFCGTPDEASPNVEAVSVFINSKIDEAFLKAHPTLRLVATRSNTSDHIDLNACRARGVAVCNVGSYGESTVPEHIFALVLALCRKLRPAMNIAAEHSFSYSALRGIELRGKTLGVMGVGHVGKQVLRLAKAFEMKTLGWDCQRDKDAAAAMNFRYVRLGRLLQLADVISINLPLTPVTFHLFNRETFAKCRPGLILINTARGSIIETDALIEALDSGIVAGAGLDVLEDERIMRKKAARILTDQIVNRLHDSFAPLEPLGKDSARISEVRSIMRHSRLLDHPNVIVTPHIAFNSIEAIERINNATVANIETFLAGRPQNLLIQNGRTSRPKLLKSENVCN